jgi:hypothetical protein
MLVPTLTGEAPTLEQLGGQVLSCRSRAPHPFYQYTLLPWTSAGKFLKYQRTDGLKPIFGFTR